MAKIIFLSGAGLSAESGVPTFRDDGGLWEKHKIEEICHIDAWPSNADMIQDFYNDMRSRLSEISPNAAHEGIARLEKDLIKKGHTIWHFTQNVDDLLERAGCMAPIYHLHGKLTEMHCPACNEHFDIGYEKWTDAGTCRSSISDCPAKTSPLSYKIKPNVIFFGEEAPLYRYLDATINALKKGDILISIGSSGSVVPTDAIAEHIPHCHRILNVLDVSKEYFLQESNWDYIIEEPATKSIGKVEKLLNELL